LTNCGPTQIGSKPAAISPATLPKLNVGATSQKGLPVHIYRHKLLRA
jgi:hypothetical protein